ncbi:MAG: elongation factor G, partial [Anderseniella sp.]|nr:elongation factor G [Anderseniella sp.]
VAVLDANAGVEPQTETVWRQADRYKVPRIVFVNKMDKIGADFDKCLSDIKERLGARPVAIQYPIGAEDQFKGLVDLIKMKAIIWKDESMGAEYVEEEIPADLKDRAEELRMEMIEAAVEMDEAAMEAYLEGNEPDAATIQSLLRKAVISNAFFPVLCGSAFKNKGVQTLLDAVVAYLPSPLEVPAIKGIDPKTEEEMVRKSSDEEPMSLLAFKIMDDPYGVLTFARIYSGKVTKGSTVLNSSRGKTERIGRMVLMHSNSREEISEAFAGDIVALVGLKEARTGDTLCDVAKPVILEKMEFPEPVIEMAVEPKTKGDQEKMGLALAKLAAEDPSFYVSTDEESGQTIIKGMGELHLDIKVDILRRQHKIDVNVGAPQVAYRETITKPTDIDYTHKKQTGGTGQFARVKFEVEPGEENTGLVFESKIVGGAVPKEYLPGVEKGLNSVMTSGTIIGFPMVDVKVTLVDGAFHEVDSSAIAFEIASRAAFREAIQKAGPVLLEPVMKVEVVTPEEYLGGIIGDLNSRRGQIAGTTSRGNAQVVNAMVPLANMFGYVNNLRSMSQGRAAYTMLFDHYSEVPRNVADEVVAKYA